MWSFFDLMKDEFLKHYHRRSNVESTFSAIKAKFGAGVRSKKFVAQQNEVLAKVLLWNLTCIIQAIEEDEKFKADFSRLVMRAA
jgi:transposase